MTDTVSPSAASPQSVDEDAVSRWVAFYGGKDVPLGELLCDRYIGKAERVALIYADSAGHEQRLTFAELRDRSARFAGVLRDLGVTKGARVATLLPKGPELLIAALAIWRLGAVQVPLFTAFGPQAIAVRLGRSGASVLVVDTTNRPKITAARALEEASALDLRTITVEGSEGGMLGSGHVPFWGTLQRQAPLVTVEHLTGDDTIILMYTSGTTGQPKGVGVPVKMLASAEQYLRFGLDVRADDVYWNIADPGWAYGLFYALIGPLLLGKPVMFFNVPFSAESIYQLMARYGVTNFAAAPTVYRALRAAGSVPIGPVRQSLRVLSSAGEPLNPDVIAWAQATLGLPIHDHYGQTELGMVVYNAHVPSLRRPLRSGSMGGSQPGYRAVVVDAAGRELDADQVGQIAIDTRQSPLFWFRGYEGDPERTSERFTTDGRYFLTGDAASRDADGYVFFSARADDVITSSAHRIGPFEVESALMGHPAVAEAAVVGKPDPLRGEIVKAFVVLKPGYVGSEELAEELSQFVKRGLAAHAYPREIDFLDQLPKTPSGKVQRYVLRGRGGPQPEGVP